MKILKTRAFKVVCEKINHSISFAAGFINIKLEVYQLFKIIVFLLICLVASSAWTSPQEFRSEQKVAVLVGIDKYNEAITGVRRLKYAVNDMKVLEKTLREQKYTVIPLHDANASKNVILHKIRQIKEYMRPGKGTLLFAFSGHGFSPDGKETSIVTFDTIISNLKETGLSVPELIREIRKVNPKKAVLFLDACRNDPSPGAKSMTKAGFMNLNPGQGIQILYSTKQAELSFEEPKFNQGIFSYFLNKGLKGEAAQDNNVTFRSISDYVEHNVSKWTLENKSKVQKPFRSTAGDVAGSFVLATAKDIILAPKPKPKPKPTPFSAPPTALIKGGIFNIGSMERGGHEKQKNNVKISDFHIGKYEVRIFEYRQCVGDGGCPPAVWEEKGSQWNLSSGPDKSYAPLVADPNQPIVGVSLENALSYVRWLSKKTAGSYRLPTEAEWEYAARGGKTSAFYWGNSFIKEKANCRGCNNAVLNRTRVVGSYEANPFGLYDMAGNAQEWTCSNYEKLYSTLFKQCGVNKQKKYSVRSSAYNYNTDSMRVAFRNMGQFTDKHKNIGFRIVRNP